MPVNVVPTRLAAEIAAPVRFCPETKEMAPRGVVPPTGPVNVIFPIPAVMLRVFAPLSVPLKRMFPSPVFELRAIGPVKVVFEAKVILSSEVVTSPPVEIPDEPVRVTVPWELISPAAAIVSKPLVELRLTVAAPEVEVRLLFRVMLVLLILAPGAAV